jgi:hypothetical protein
MSDYRTSAIPVRVLEVGANHARGSLTVGTLALLIVAVTFAVYPTINRGRFDFACTRIEKGGDAIACILTRSIFGFQKRETMNFTASSAVANVESEELVPEECPKCSRVAVRSRESAVNIGRFPATLAEAVSASYDLDDFFATPTQERVHFAYGPRFETVPVFFWSAIALLLAASLAVRRFHRVILKWNPLEKYLTLERRHWPFRTKVEHVPNDVLIGASISGKELLETELRFESGRRLSLFGRTAGNIRVHERAVARIERFLLEDPEGSP